jgi:hypothetical protein
VPKDQDAPIPPEPDSDPAEPAGSVKDRAVTAAKKARAVTAAKKARAAVSTAKTTAKDSAIEAFDKVIDSLDSLGQKRDRPPDE